MARLAWVLVAAALAGAPALSQCSMAWTDALCANGVGPGPVSAALAFDDGTGPALYVGGMFTTAGGAAANMIARWWGGKWAELPGIGPGMPFLNGVSINALATYDPGSGTRIYAGGTFWTAGGVPAGNIASWNGTAWSALGAGVAGSPVSGQPPRVNAMIAFDDGTGSQLVVAGRFTTAGGVPVSSIARWNGTTWSALGFGFTEVNALAIHDAGTGPALYAAGSAIIGGVTVHGVARWSGAIWIPAGGPASGPVTALAPFDAGAGPRLAAGGMFTSVNGVAASNVAQWDGALWSPLGAGTDAPVRALRAFDDGSGQALYAGGWFSMAGTATVSTIARFGGGVWSALGGGLGGGAGSAVNALAELPTSGGGSSLVAAGSFITAYSTPGSPGIAASGVASWTGSSWVTFERGMGGGFVTDFTTFDDGSGPALYAVGTFTSAGGVEARYVARRTLTGWAPVGGGFNAPAQALEVFDDGMGPALYAAGDFTASGGVTLNGIARLVNGSWAPLGFGLVGVGATVRDLAVFDDGSGPALYAGGQFQFSGGWTASNFGKWNGVSWQQFTPGVTGAIFALQVFDDGNGPALYAGGVFNSGGPSPNIARLTGAGWAPVGTGIIGGNFGASVETLAVHDFGSGPRLLAGGNLSASGSNVSDAVVQWNGAAWSTVAAPPPGASGGASGWSFAAFDDGTGSALYMGTAWNGAGSPTFPGLWRLTPTGWTPVAMAGPPPLPSGISPVSTLHVFNGGAGPALWAGGAFTQSASGVGSGGVARLGFPRAVISLAQPAGPGTAGYVVSSDLVAGHEYFNVFSPDVCPGPPGSGPYLGLCSNNPNILIAQVLLPLGSPPFHFIAQDRFHAFGPFTLSAGTVYEAICSDFTGGMLHCVSQVGRLSMQ